MSAPCFPSPTPFLTPAPPAPLPSADPAANPAVGPASPVPCRRCGLSLPDGAPFCPWCGTRQQPQHRKRARGHGEGTVYQLANGTYRADLSRFTQGRRFRATQSGFARKKDALAAIPRLRAKIEEKIALASGIEPPDPLAGATLRQVYAEWQKSRACEKLSASKRAHYRTAWERMRPTWDLQLAPLRLSTMQQVVDSCPGGYYPKRDIKALYSHLYKYAIRHELTEHNRAQLLELPECKSARREAWRPEELTAWWQAYRRGDRIARLVLIMTYTGMRTGELQAQDPSQVFLERRYLVGGIKTQAGRGRVIPLAEVILPLMGEALAEARYGLLPMRREDFYDEYAQAAQRAGVRPLPPYSCRHTAATALAEAGVAPAVIREIMGHTDYSTTLHYTHISTEKKIEAVNALPPGQAAEL